MSDENPHPGPEQPPHVHRYGPPAPEPTFPGGSAPGSAGPEQPDPYAGSQPTATFPAFTDTDRTRRPRPSSGVVAGILVAALAVGGVSGLAGAAGFTAVNDFVDGGSSSSATTSKPVRSTVAESPDTPAPEGSVEQVASSVLPSVVKINVVGAQAAGSGSGIILSSDGEILTNNHVVEVATDGGSISVNFNDGSAARARIIGTDPLTDLAVIKAEGVSGLTPATLGRSGNVDVGENVVAIGSPFGLQATVTSGIVSALNRPVSVGESPSGGNDTTYPAIQTDAAINPGNSGGPLVNMSGEVIGINSSIRTASSQMSEGGSIGLGFAIPLDKVLPVVEQLRNGETPTHARLGVSVADITSRDGLLTGAVVRAVNPGSAADEAGLARGDVVTKIGEDIVNSSESLVATVRGHRPGDEVQLTVVRGSKTRTVTVTLDSDEGSASS